MKIKSLLTKTIEVITTLFSKRKIRKKRMTTELKDKQSQMVSFKRWLRSWWQAALTGFFLGVTTTHYYAYNSLINDCKVIGAFRIGNVAFGCQMSKVPA